MRTTIVVITVAMPGAGFAHGGHLGEAAGHDHWVAGAAIGLAIGLSAWSAWRGRRRTEAADDEEPEEADESADRTEDREGTKA